jgi:predicted RNase H-like HicB family nuclease
MEFEMKRKSHKKSVRHHERHYTVILEHDVGGYHAFCPALAGCHSQGNTIEETMKNIQEAVELYCESLIEDGEKLPIEDLIIRPMAISV